MKVLLFPGSFDPFTLGHQNIAKRASRICDKLIVAVLENDSKNPLFSLSERKELIKKSLAKYKNIEVISYQGLLVDLYKDTGATATVRGLRSESDFRYETEMALANRPFAAGIVISVCTETAPADSPNSVMLLVFPPNAPILRRTHCSAASWSSNP